MLKLPKGLKKKKKGKKSKKDQELFTEEELAQYKKEHQQHPIEVAEEHPPQPTENDEEWSRFAALTTGVDSILKKTQGDLDRIKSTSFFKKVPTQTEQAAEQAQADLVEHEAQLLRDKENQEELAAAAKANALLNAVVELSESEEEESDFEDNAFNTSYVDQELPLAYVEESPEHEFADGPDPFDTGYAEKVIKGPEVSSRGKRLVHIGAAVEVLTGKVEAVSTAKRRARRGPQNLLLESFDEDPDAPATVETSQPKQVLSLLDDGPSDLLDEGPIDLSVSLHLTYQKEKERVEEAERAERALNKEPSVDEFDTLKNSEQDDEDDEFAQLAAESLTRSEDTVLHLSDIQSTIVVDPESTDTWAAEFQESDGKPKRPPPPVRPATGPHIGVVGLEIEEDDFELDGDDPFDTAYVEKVVPKSLDYDSDFDPRGTPVASPTKPLPDLIGEEHQAELFAAKNDQATSNQLGVQKKDLLGGSTHDLTQITAPIAVSAELEEEIDPFDTSAVDKFVAPGKSELKFLEKELLKDLSDDDFDPRADEPEEIKPIEALRQRKSSLVLQINSSPKLCNVSFSVNEPQGLLKAGEGGNKKPVTPYYSRDLSINEDQEDQPQTDHLYLGVEDHDCKVLTPANLEEEEEIDPFDTSIAYNIAPGQTELKLLEDELLEKVAPEIVVDILSDQQESLSNFVKVLTPQPTGSIDLEDDVDFDPFDTTFASNIVPGATETRLIESEFAN